MKNPVIRWLEQLRQLWNAGFAQKPDRGADGPDKLRRSVLVGGVALIASGLLLGDLVPSAQAHSRRRSRRWDRRGRHNRRHSRRHHGRRRSWYRRHSRRRSRYDYHGRRRSRYDYHNRRRSRYEYDYHSRRRSRRGGFDLYLEF